MRLSGDVAIITGASRSIGAAIAKCYAAEGAKVVVNYRSNPELAEEVVAEIIAAGGEAFAYKANVAEEHEVQAMIDETLRRYGRIDILVNNAGIDPRKKWNEITVAEWDNVMAVNVRSQFICSKAVFPAMEQQGRGKIINVSSVVFWSGQKNYVHYVASKGAIVGFTRGLAREVGEQNITVNCITPGAVMTETELEKVGTIEDQAQATSFLEKAQCFPRRQLSKDIEGAFVFLASRDSDFITGQTLNVDGGWMMH
ncbi:3-oxoacyl-ACP reductase FabG [Paenibacillus psychroresistens]|uniref:3-oxoacyl-ACP reductase FabG n=1 Tax=Paenibacillus psychroresistens TaxID=1778678 RepID=A0A6B8RGA9_9BACL|nr:3-oxoacyl-ACP reductase family protein [Paenibacillus psychroresistens]QGQ94552.1 3-oxoacyl-ACP reductase FabG [Paenibacillus psychroresistens]